MKKTVCTMICCWMAFLSGCGAPDTGAYLLETEAPSLERSGEAVPAGAPEQKAEVFAQESLMVYVCGEVSAPGVYELAAGSRICDAIEMAGGFRETASTDYWNLAQPLADGQMIFVPTREEARERMAAFESRAEETDGRININTASLEQLVTLPGVGQAKGKAILAFREANGAFSKVEDIMRVSGIGDAVFEKIREYITVD